MTLAVAKYCKITKKSDIYDVLNTSIMSDMPQNFIPKCLDDDCTYQVSSPYEVFNLLAVADMSEKKTPLDLWGGVYPPPPLGCHGNHLPLI